jgi:Aminoacyl-tRNA editing domain
VRLGTEQEFSSLFPDCELGAMPPFGALYNLPVYVDESLAADEAIVFNAGTHRDAIRMRYGDAQGLVIRSERVVQAISRVFLGGLCSDGLERPVLRSRTTGLFSRGHRRGL